MVGFIDPAKVFLTPYVQARIDEENARIRAELHSQGPTFSVSSINSRLRQVRQQAEDEEAAAAAAQQASSGGG